MNRNVHRLAVCLLLWFGAMLSSAPIKADVVFPARLEIKEIQPGIFEVVFVLPVIQGKVLKAQPILPAECQWLTEPQLSGNLNVRISRWQISCPSDALYGKKFGIEGLLGSQVDILFNLEMLNGRSYQTMLSPVNAFFVVPAPPAVFEIIKIAIIRGLRSMLIHGTFYLLILVVLLTYSTGLNPAVRITAWVVLGYALGQQLTAIQWLMVPENLPETATLLATLILSISLVYNLTISSDFYGWLLILLGTVYGSADYLPQAIQGYDAAEHLTFNVVSYAGIGIGVLIIYWLSVNFAFTIEYFIKHRKVSTVTGYLAGIISAGLLLYNLSAYLFGSGIVWNIPWLPVLYIMVLSIWTVKSGFHSNFAIPALLLLLTVGLFLSKTGVDWEWAASGVLMVIMVMTIHFVLGTIPAKWFDLFFTGFGTLTCGYYMSHLAEESLSYANAQIVGFMVVLALIFVMVQQMSKIGMPMLVIGRSAKLVSGVILLAIVGFAWFQEFSANRLTQFMANYAVGRIHIPIVSMLLVVLVIWFWPRYRSIHKNMGVKRRPPIISLYLLGLSVIVSPWFTVLARSPFSSPGITDLDRAEVVVQQVLSNTYHAFNLEDEDQLYEQLALSVDQELIEDIYLDSRRKLRAGVRQGAEVLVKEVELLDFEQTETPDGPSKLQFESTWVVTARVKHLQHIHHRKNQYSGSILLKTEGAEWKISEITLTSEERTIVPNTSG